MPDNYGNFGSSLDAPAYGVYVATPDDNSDLPIWSRAIRPNGGGTIAIIGADGVTTTCNFLAGETRAIRAKRIKSTGTTATTIEIMY